MNIKQIKAVRTRHNPFSPVAAMSEPAESQGSTSTGTAPTPERPVRPSAGPSHADLRKFYSSTAICLGQVCTLRTLMLMKPSANFAGTCCARTLSAASVRSSLPWDVDGSSNVRNSGLSDHSMQCLVHRGGCVVATASAYLEAFQVLHKMLESLINSCQLAWPIGSAMSPPHHFRWFVLMMSTQLFATDHSSKNALGGWVTPARHTFRRAGAWRGCRHLRGMASLISADSPSLRTTVLSPLLIKFFLLMHRPVCSHVVYINGFATAPQQYTLQQVRIICHRTPTIHTAAGSHHLPPHPNNTHCSRFASFKPSSFCDLLHQK